MEVTQETAHDHVGRLHRGFGRGLLQLRGDRVYPRSRTARPIPSTKSDPRCPLHPRCDSSHHHIDPPDSTGVRRHFNLPALEDYRHAN